MIVGAALYVVVVKSMLKTYRKATKDMFDDDDWRL